MNACRLADRDCVPCKGGIPPLTGAALAALVRELNHGWEAADEQHLTKEFRFKNFRAALDFTNAIGELAEKVGHHPELQLGWGHVRVELWTHKIDGLSEADFVLAAKIEALPRPA